MGFNATQVRQLLQAINPRRVLKDGKGNSHVAQQDITAHLNRMFGFGNWDKEVLYVELVYENEYMKNNSPRFEVCYKALVKLTIKDANGNVVCSYTDGSMGSAEGLPKRHAAHDLAYKSAISLSLKRAAKDLGDQFGLSLYNKGQMSAIVKSTLVGLDDAEVTDVQQNVEQVVALGNDEIDHEPSPADVAREDLRELCRTKHWNMKAVADLYLAGQDAEPKIPLGEASADDVRAYMALLESGTVTVS